MKDEKKKARALDVGPEDAATLLGLMELASKDETREELAGISLEVIRRSEEGVTEEETELELAAVATELVKETVALARKYGTPDEIKRGHDAGEICDLWAKVLYLMWRNVGPAIVPLSSHLLGHYYRQELQIIAAQKGWDSDEFVLACTEVARKMA